LDCHDAAIHLGRALCLGAYCECRESNDLSRLRRAVQNRLEFRKALALGRDLNALQLCRRNGDIRSVLPLRLRNHDLAVRNRGAAGELLSLGDGRLIRIPLPSWLLRISSRLLLGISSWLLLRISSWLLLRISSRLLLRISSRLLLRISSWLLLRISSRLLPGITRLLLRICSRLLRGITRLGLHGRRLGRLCLGLHVV
jgi:hypothetical protein